MFIRTTAATRPRSKWIRRGNLRAFRLRTVDEEWAPDAESDIGRWSLGQRTITRRGAVGKPIRKFRTVPTSNNATPGGSATVPMSSPFFGTPSITTAAKLSKLISDEVQRPTADPEATSIQYIDEEETIARMGEKCKADNGISRGVLFPKVRICWHQRSSIPMLHRLNKLSVRTGFIF
ncbi:hypothetical protein AB6A40_001759 [Gnathostoma spinigerum]|uniref:Uncharacterized protein n=1 Tax=Gnathostoma spinigerum TaxID=75299 RepID=A0ABD6E4X8_9BILA